MDLKYNFIPQILLGLMIVAAVGIIFALIWDVRYLTRKENNSNRSAKIWQAVTIVCVIVAAVSWVLNFGWIRFALTFLPIPLIYTIIFVVINFKAANVQSSSEKIKKYLPITCTLYLLTFFLFPDGGDVGGMYFFFSLIRNNAIAAVALILAQCSLIAGAVFLGLLDIETKKCKADVVQSDTQAGEHHEE